MARDINLPIELLNDVIEHLPVGLALWEIQDITDVGTWKLVLGNTEYDKMSGISWKDFRGKTLREGFPKALETSVPEIWKKAVMTGQTQQMPDLDYHDEHVARGVFSIRVIPIGERYLCQILKNITAERVAEESLEKGVFELKTEKNKLETLLESIGDGIIVIDRAWNITLFNKAATTISGYTSEEAIGKPLRRIIKFIKDGDRSENITFIEHAIVTGKIGLIYEPTSLIRKDGSEVPIGDSAAPIFGPGNRIEGAIIIFRDTSKEHELNSIRSDFTYASHQMRTPITSAMWTLENALDENDPSKQKEYIKTAYLSLKSLEKLADQLLMASSIDQKMIFPKKETVKFADVFKVLLDGTEKRAKLRNISVAGSLVPPTLAINTDIKLLKRVLEEVLDNALIYNVSGGNIRFDISEYQQGILIEVQDTGTGIASEDVPIIFTRFFRGSNFDKTHITGGGLGLFISRELVKLLSGKMWFQSEEGKGALFSIFLPNA